MSDTATHAVVRADRQGKAPADVTCWAVPIKPDGAGKSCPLHAPTEREHSAPLHAMPGALSDTIGNILGLVKQGDVAHAAAEGAERGHGRPPSAKCINKALHAVLVAAEETAAEKTRVRPGVAPQSVHDAMLHFCACMRRVRAAVRDTRKRCAGERRSESASRAGGPHQRRCACRAPQRLSRRIFSQLCLQPHATAQRVRRRRRAAAAAAAAVPCVKRE